MSRAQRLPTFSLRLTRGVSGAWLFARWLLVLALVFDQVSAPFHHHHHDGMETQLELAASHDTMSGGDETHADSDDHVLGSHSAMAIRVDASRLGQLPAIDLAHVAIAVDIGLQLLAAFDSAMPEHWARDRSVPDFRSHRSLPPAGRAPPFHA